MEYENDQQGYEDDRDMRGYRERSNGAENGGGSRARSASPGGRDRMDTRPPMPPVAPAEDEDEAQNTGSNLFVTGIHPRLSEEDVTRLFEKYGEVHKCNIMRDPHSRESRGFGFVDMGTGQQADAAKEGLQGEVYEGRTLSIEKARRSRPRVPTPGRYYGPPKRDDIRRGPSRGRYEDRYSGGDRRGGGSYGGYSRRDDYGGGGGGGGGGYRGGSRYGGDRSDRGGDRGGDRYERSERSDRPPRPRYDERPPRDGPRDDRYRDDRARGGRDDAYGGRPGPSDAYDEPLGARNYGGRGYDDRGADSSRR